MVLAAEAVRDDTTDDTSDPISDVTADGPPRDDTTDDRSGVAVSCARTCATPARPSSVSAKERMLVGICILNLRVFFFGGGGLFVIVLFSFSFPFRRSSIVFG